jgi:TPR repeat protein
LLTDRNAITKYEQKFVVRLFIFAMGSLATIVTLAQTKEDGFVYQPNATVEEKAGAQILLGKAEQGDAAAQLEISKGYAKGYVFKPNPAAAVKWARAAAEQGLAEAQINLGSYYYFGAGVAQDYSKSYYWTRKAADQGNAVAEQNIALMVANGLGTRRDIPAAIHWYEKAAEQGHPAAAYNVGQAYSKGIGIVKDEVKGYMWHLLALHFGYQLSRNALKLLDGQMTEAQRAEAHQRADDWIRTHPNVKPIKLDS